MRAEWSACPIRSPRVRRHAIHLDQGIRDRPVGGHAARRAGDEAADFHLSFRRDIDPLGIAADDEVVDLAEGAGVKAGFAMIDGAEDQIGGAAQRRTIGGDAGGHARLAEQAAVGLRIFVDAIAAEGQESGTFGHLRALAGIEAFEERAAAVEFAAGTVGPVEHAVIGVPHSTAWLTSALPPFSI